MSMADQIFVNMCKIRDDNVIETANRYNMVVAFTGMRLFHH